jgi:5-methylcytosine-specific restriction endonuclease McrA
LLTKDVVSAIRRVYSDTVARDFKWSNVLEHTLIDKKEVIQCSHCGELFYVDEITVHHTISVIPPQLTYRQMSYHLFHERLNCSWKHLQLLCLPCHQIEGSKEDQERKEWKNKKKQLVCRSKRGGKMRVHPLVDLDRLDKMWEVMDVASTRRKADAKMRRWRKS